MFNLHEFKQSLQKGLVAGEDIQGYIDDSNRLWMKRLSTEFLMNYITYREVAKEDGSKDILAADTRLTEVHNRIVGFCDNIDLAADNSGLLAELLEDRAYLEEAMKQLSAYGDYCTILEYVFNRHESVDNVVVEEDKDFVGSVIQFIFSEEDNMVINDKIHDVFGELPIRLSKNKFYNMLERSIDMAKGATERGIDQYMDYLGEAFKPESVDGFGVNFSAINNEIKIIESLLEPLDEQVDVMEGQDRIYAVSQVIVDSVSFYILLTAVLNLLIGLLYSANSDNVAAEEAHYHLITQTFSHLKDRGEEEELISEMVQHLLVKLEGVIEEVAMSLLSNEGLNQQVLSFGVTDTYEQQLKDIEKCYLLTSGSYYGSLEAAEESPVASLAYVAKKKHSLIEGLKETFKSDSRVIGRARMARLLKVMNIVQASPEELYQFILMNFEGCKNELEKGQSQNLIRLIMEMD